MKTLRLVVCVIGAVFAALNGHLDAVLWACATLLYVLRLNDLEA